MEGFCDAAFALDFGAAFSATACVAPVEAASAAAFAYPAPLSLSGSDDRYSVCAGGFAES